MNRPIGPMKRKKENLTATDPIPSRGINGTGRDSTLHQGKSRKIGDSFTYMYMSTVYN